MLCLDCGCELVESQEPLVEEYRGETFSIEGIPHFKCPNCGEYMVNANNAKTLSKALASQYAESHDLLTPDQIVSLRKTLGLNQSEFQKMLGVTGVTVCRWETGRIPQTRVVDNLMRVLAKYPHVANDLIEWANNG